MKQLPGQGRGLVARQRIAKGELLLNVPLDALVVDEARALRESAAVRAVAGGLDLPQWSVLALWLAEQRHYLLNGGGGGDGVGRGEWAPYIETLPERAGTVLDWLPGQVSAS